MLIAKLFQLFLHPTALVEFPETNYLDDSLWEWFGVDDDAVPIQEGYELNPIC